MIDTVLTDTEVERSVWMWFLVRKAILPRVIIFVLHVPFVCEYSHKQHTKKKALLQRSTICWAKTPLETQEHR